MKGTLLNIAVREKTKAPMQTLDAADVTFDKGVACDSRGRKRNNRQVTILTSERWNDACNELNAEIPWTYRRANFFIEGIELANTTGKKIQIGDLQLEITGELVPCNRMDAQHSGLTNALKSNWRGGVTCKIISEGHVKIGDEVELIA